ncbi:hypothetical protein PPERSA_00771 [Pseudocohnilembus persalinus]|uniref:Thioredoxin-like fold n=1 Tax=Pseudocohnilembus persalinus TaxID=266149 RepID=A0A0V0Q9U7_PSEPJ|nr:hypothetical protein PPERSA_00771 [Pseudocohnilembus persalinus]|eukprot:KRW98944.1 hypothetical protein PPERSA_00771 [Pseudocohnilembus persalinus]
MKKLTDKIGFNLLPKTLKTRVQLPNIGKIEIKHKNQCQMYLSTINFLKSYGPSIQYYNDLKINHITDSQFHSPIYTIYDQNNKQIESFEVGTLKNGDSILEKIMGINDQLNANNKAEIKEVTYQEAEEQDLKLQQQ